MKNNLKNLAKEVRGILVDSHAAETHPHTLQRLGHGATIELRAKHAVHKAINHAGRLASVGYEKKMPRWPVAGEVISVLGYGAEKIAYRVDHGEGKPSSVLSVYHRESIGKDPIEVVHKKQEAYDTYREHFGELVVPTAFMVVDNPWGDGAKPASIQPFITSTHKLADYSVEQLEQHLVEDPKFADNFRHLQTGYEGMKEEGVLPDFASGNVLVSGSDIMIIDTGTLFPAESAAQLRSLHPSYQPVMHLLEVANQPQLPA